ncbi:MAG: class B sortase [Clostridia bacterium]|nr:class B sortase [Clostridia bacterium]
MAWLYSPNQVFNTPLVYSKDAEHYLQYRFDDKLDTYGGLFFTGDTAPDFTEPVLILRGLNATDNALFGSLNNYRNDKEYYEQNPSLYLLTPQGDYQLDIFAGVRTSQSDDTSWIPSITEPMTSLDAVLERSFLTAMPDLLPEENDQWIILSAEGRSQDSIRYVIYTRCRPITYSGNETAIDLIQTEMDSRETLNDWYTVDGVGRWMVYGQNDPSWNRLTFETRHSSRRRPFGDGGCGPTAIALAIANLLEPEELLKINNYAPDPYGYTICSCALTPYYCRQYHVPYRVDEPEEMLRYFPLVVGSFATGYNTLGVQGRYDRFGSNMDYLPALCEQVYGITLAEADSKESAFQFLQDGKGLAITCTGRGSPFTSSSHYLTLAGADDTYLYILDPMRRVEEDYEALDYYDWLEVITPGLVRLKKSNALNMMMSPIYLLSRPN